MKKYWRSLLIAFGIAVILWSLPKVAEVAMATGALRGVDQGQPQRDKWSNKAATVILIDLGAVAIIILGIFSRKRD